jgi:hypothetical protein
MRTAALTLISFVAFGFAAGAQKFSLLPQVGFENSKTKIRYNDLPSFSPAGINFSPQVGLLFTYTSKPGHGLFLGAASSRSIVPFSFTDPENGMNNYKTTTGDMQLRFETGYQFNSKPLYFKKQGTNAVKPGENKISEKKSCGSFSYRSHCMKNKTAANRSSNTDKLKQQAQGRNKGSWVRLQPSVGMGFIPVVKTDVITKTQNGLTTYEYNAGNWNTALMTGMGFEFGKNKSRLFTLSVNYFKGLGNLDKQTISTVIGSKTLTTHLQSEVSGWNMRIGVPFTLGAKKSGIQKQTEKNTQQRKTNCSQYRTMYRCNKSN